MVYRYAVSNVIHWGVTAFVVIAGFGFTASSLAFSQSTNSFKAVITVANAGQTADPCVIPRAARLRHVQQSTARGLTEEQLKLVRGLEQIETRCRTGMRAGLSVRELKLREVTEATELEFPAPIELGMTDPVDPLILGRQFDVPTAPAWRGYINGELLVADGTALADNPMQGVLFLMNDNDRSVSGSAFYNTPTATGPVKIVAESNAVLELESIASPDRAPNASTNVRGSGGVKYFFDLRTRKFQ